MKPLYHIPIEIVNAELGQPLASHRTPILRYPLSTERIRIRSLVTTCALPNSGSLYFSFPPKPCPLRSASLLKQAKLSSYPIIKEPCPKRTYINYTTIPVQSKMVLTSGLEPLTPTMSRWCANHCAMRDSRW